MKCSNCESEFRGFRCPKCGMGTKPFNTAVGCLTVALPTAIVVVLVLKHLPAERIPRVVAREDGAAEYHVQSRRAATLWAVVPLSFLGFGILSGLVFRVKKVQKPEAEAPGGLRGFLIAVAARAAGLFVLVAFVYIVSGLVALLVTDPLSAWRVTVVDDADVRFRSLLRTWTIPRSSVVDARMVERKGRGRSGRGVELWFIVDDDRGGHHESAEFCSDDGTSLRAYRTVFRKLRTHLMGCE